MGSSPSKAHSPAPVNVPTDHGPLPTEPAVPYPGPCVQHRIVEMNVTFKQHIQFVVTPGADLTTTNVDDYYPTLRAQYQEGFNLLSFFRIPWAGRVTGLFTMTAASPFQGIFYRYPTVPSQERWQLKIEKSAMYVQRMTTMRILSETSSQSSADTSHLIDTIARNADSGGRLICLEETGVMSAQRMHMDHGIGVGVDLFFNMPLQPNPTQYIYQCVNAPIPLQYTPTGFARCTIDIPFDFIAHLGAYLNQGYRLVEIFYDKSASLQRRRRFLPTTMNTIWFFEKEAARANDNSPVYEACVVEYYLKLQQGFGKITASANWGPLIEDMGNKGWELACTLETPKMQRAGFGTSKQTILLFFQRPLLGGHGHAGFASAPIGLLDPSTEQPVGNPDTAFPPPQSCNEIVKQ